MTSPEPRSSAPPIPEVEPRASARRQQVRARRRSPTFESVLLGITAGLHVGGAVAFWFAADALGLPLPAIIGAIAAITLTYAFRPVVLDTFPDRRRSRWRVRLLELPYLIHWCALVPALVALAIAAVVRGVQALLHAPTPVSIPAWVFCAYAAGLVLSAWGVLVRRHLVRVRRLTVVVPGLPAAFAGFRIVQLSDLHVGSFATPAAARGWVGKANAQRADMAVVTGDLVSGGVEYHLEIAHVVGSLAAPEGIVVIPGNHDYFGEGEPLFGLLQARGVRLLRNESFVLERGEAKLVVAGVDDAWTGRRDLERTLESRPAVAPTLLLAHDPAIFPRAAERGVALVLSGHTHGGQIAVPFLARWLNVSALAHRYQLGVYRDGDSTLVVSAGLGTTGPPIRLGAAPEIVVVELVPGPASH